MLLIDISTGEIKSGQCDPIEEFFAGKIKKVFAAEIADICAQMGPFFVADVVADCSQVYSEHLNRKHPQVREIMRRYAEELTKMNDRYSKLLLEAEKTCSHPSHSHSHSPEAENRESTKSFLDSVRILNLRAHG